MANDFINKLVYELHSANYFVAAKKLADNELELKLQGGFKEDLKGNFRMRFVIRLQSSGKVEAYWVFYDKKNELVTMGNDPEIMARDLNRRLMKLAAEG